VALLLVTSTACSSNSGSAENTQAAQAQYCSDLNVLKTDLLAVRNLGPTSSVGQAKDGVNKIQDDLSQLSKSARSYQSAKTDQLNASYQDLQKSAQGLSDNTSMAAAVATLTPHLQAVNDAQSQQLKSSCQ
jgi:hypothetical protein